jgi:hypothetical protein
MPSDKRQQSPLFLFLASFDEAPVAASRGRSAKKAHLISVNDLSGLAARLASASPV